MKKIYPYQTIGIIGGGQLGKMTAITAKEMGYNVAILDPTPNCPAAQVSDTHITAEYRDLEAIKQLAEVSNVVTYEFENIDADALDYLISKNILPQGSEVLKTTKHRFLEKSAIANLGIKVPKFILINSAGELREKIFYPSVLKTTTGGYDGKGQVVLKSEVDLDRACELADGAECILEEFLHFDKEISVIVARSITGEVACLPTAENVHVNNILHTSVVPAKISVALQEKAQECAVKIAENFKSIGVMGVEMFVTGDEIYINELAPRPHNSGHYSMDACNFSQFDLHVRAICGLPLGTPKLLTEVVMVNILGQHLNMENIADSSHFEPLLSRGKLHLYGKEKAVINRKMGHINLLGDVDESLKMVEKSKIWQ